MITTITLSKRIEVAKKMTARSAALKDYKVRSKKKREMREIARNLTAGKGYIIASPEEMEKRYPKYFKDWAVENKKMVFSIDWNIVWGELQFVAL